jgi:hypothetical protein
MPLNVVAKAAITVGLALGNMALTMTRKIMGPRLDDLKFTSGDYGAPLPLVWGLRRLDVPIFWAENLREVKQRRKTKGGKFNEYTYFGTWAVALAGHEIDGVARIWFDTHPVYDLTGSGPVTPFDFGGTASIDDVITIYTGSETQEPDPRMQATVEAQFGEGSCPAYRGTAYIVFKDVPLEKIGNRIPQVSVEVVSNASAAYPYADLEDAWEYAVNVLFTPERALLYIAGNMSFGAPFTYIDVAARTSIISGEQLAEVKAIDPWGTLWADGDEVQNIQPDGAAVLDYNSGQLKQPDGVTNTTAVDLFAFDYDGQPFIGIAPTNGRDDLMYWQPPAAVVSLETSAVTGDSWSPQFFCQDTDGDIWAFGAPNGSGTTLHFLNVTGSASFSITGLADIGSGIHVVPARHYKDAANDHFLVEWASDLLIIDRATGVLLDTVALGNTVYRPFKNSRPTDPTWYQYESGSQAAEYSAVDGSLVRLLTLTDWSTGTALGGIYDAVNHAWIGLMNDGSLRWHFLDRIAGGTVTLETICNDVADLAGVEDYDFSDLTQTVQGWSATRGQASNMIGPLLDTFDSDIAPHDFTIRGLKRTGTTGGTLTTERFVANDPRYTVTVRQAAELPRATLVTFADVDADQQPNTIRSERPHDATGAVGEEAIDMGTLASDPDEMRGLADRFHRRIWNSRQEVSLSLTAQQLALEPGDVRTLELDDETMVARLVRVTVSADDTLNTEWRYDHPSLAVLGNAAGAAFDGREPSVIIVPLISKGFVLDIPLIEDADNDVNPLLYVAAAPYASGTWPGAVIYEEVDGEYSEEAASVPSSASAAWGYTTDVLPDANPWLWDRGSSVNVTMQTGTLTGTTEAAIDANPRTNMALIGDEIVNFTTATLEGDGTYTLSGFKRGRRGTEWACATHAVRDVFLLLDTAEPVEQGLSEVGTDLSFKAVTNGRTESGAFPIPLVHLEAVKESNGDWTLSWVRRTRVGGAWTSGTTIPLGETSEEYELDLGDGVTTVTKTGLTSPTYTWDVATQTSDTGAEVMAGDLEWAAVQISASVDRGFEAEATA